MSLVFEYAFPGVCYRPLFKASFNNSKVLCLFDSGADMSVCCSKKWLQRVCKNIKQIGTETLRGFGGEVLNCPIYTLGTVIIADSWGNSFVFDDFRVIYEERKDFVMELVLGAGVFNLCNTFLSPTSNRIQFMSNFNRFGLTYPNKVVTATVQLSR